MKVNIKKTKKKLREILAKRKFPKIGRRFVVVAVICLLAFGGIYRFYLTPKLHQPKKNDLKFSQVTPVDKTLNFPAITNTGKYQGEISLTIVSTEMTNEVLVKNQPVRTKQGKFFLIVNLELENESTEKLGLVSSDLIRLRIGENGKKIAPDLHNKQVLISPVSVKTDKVGFVVTGSENIPLALELGEFYRTREVREKIELEF